MSSLRSRCAPALLLFAALAGCCSGSPSRYHSGAREPADGERIAIAEEYNHVVENPFLAAKDHPLSTFSTSVDTASYSNLRRFLNEGSLPPADAVRIADMLNYFRYDYPEPRGEHPVAVALELGPCPWQAKHHLLKIAVKAKTMSTAELPSRNFVFLIDTSGSMSSEERLPLVKKSLELLVQQLGENDRVSIVTYAGDASLRLSPTPGNQPMKIMSAIRGLTASGSTNGGGGIEMAYEQAQAGFIPHGVNRVILATDGDFNVGVSSEGELVRLIEKKRTSGIYLTVLGYGMGNLKDNKLEQLAHHGNGHYAYIDSLAEAKKVFVDQGGALAVVAKDVKLQVEFNHNHVNAYRLIGYENRVMRNEDFQNDAKDAGEMGSGHTCTALYEIVPIGVSIPTQKASELKYQEAGKDKPAAGSPEWLTVRLRYKHPDDERANEFAVTAAETELSQHGGADYRLAATVAAFGMLLRDSEYKGTMTYPALLRYAEESVREKSDENREELVRLIHAASVLDQLKRK